MSDDLIELEPAEDLAEKKSFWNHLDDLRKVLVNSVKPIDIALM